MIIELTGRIDSSNAADVEKVITERLDKLGEEEVSFDAGELSYISSAGLRILMKVRKRFNDRLEITNVSRDVYDIFETTGFTELFDVKKAYRRLSVDGMEVIGKGFFGTVYRIDAETIVKVYRGKDSIPMIENEKAMAKKAFLSGIPTAISYDIVQVGEDYGSVFELLNARTFHELAQSGDMPLEDVITKYAGLLKLVHTTRLEAGTFPSYKEKFLDHLEVIKKHLTEEQYDGLKKLLTKVGDDNTVVHGDIQMKNVMLSDGEAMLIDMDTLGLGNPVFEFAGLYVTYRLFEEDDPDNAMSFLGMTNEMVEEIWNRIVDAYFDPTDDARKNSILERIALVGAVRFLYILETTELKEGELGKKRIAHAREHIDRLLRTVEQVGI